MSMIKIVYRFFKFKYQKVPCTVFFRLRVLKKWVLFGTFWYLDPPLYDYTGFVSL